MRDLFRSVMSTSILVMIGRGVGFLVPFVIAAAYGLSRETDAFFLAYGIILFLQLVLGNVFETAVVPYCTAQSMNQEKLGTFFGSILIRSTAVLAGFALILILTVNGLLRHVAGLDPETAQLGSKLLYEMIAMIFLIAWTSALNGALNAAKCFYPAALSPAIRSAVVIAMILVLKDKLSVHAIAAGYLCGEALRFAFSLFIYHSRIGTIRFGWTIDPHAKLFFRSALMQTAAFSILSSLALVNQFMAAQLGAGDVTLLTYGERLRNIPYLLFVTGVLSVIFSYWSGAYSRMPDEFDWDHCRKLILKLTAGAFALAWVLIFLRQPLTELALARGAFPQEELKTAAGVFAWLILGFPFDVAALLSIRLLIIKQKEIAYLGLAALRIMTTIVLNAILMKQMGVVGIAVSTTVVNAVVALALFQVTRGGSEAAKPWSSG